ncbi:SGNH/GDSL hydrolase family protein [Flavobacterium longum]|uniref:hypothetical protein n=1 Tax=Flavobacterium longum TaxID=1299340 RepID=UPI0039ED64D6
MRKFLWKSALFFGIVLAIVSFVLLRYGGYIDYFYEKFTVGKQSSFIIGDSRAHQGIQPRVIDSYFRKNEFDGPMFNYSFTISQAAYGKPYTESILKKLKPDTKNGLFILTVDPWLLAQREKDNVANGFFEEQTSPPHNMWFDSMNPNFEYFIRNFRFLHLKSIIRKSSMLHKDGWLEESNLPTDSLMLADWKKNQLRIYRDFAKHWKRCDYRKTDLQILIEKLKPHGKIFLVRTPIDAKLLAIEDQFWLGFDQDIETIAHKTGVPYLNFVREDVYRTYDGNHLDKFGGKVFTAHLCDSINKYRKP